MPNPQAAARSRVAGPQTHLVRLRRRIARLPVAIGYIRGPRYASALRKWWVLLRHPHVEISFGRNTYLGPGFSFDAPHGGRFIVGDAVRFRRNFRAELAGSASRITIGDGSVLSCDVLIQCVSTIDIGRRCHFGQSTLIVDATHRFRDITKPVFDQGMDARPMQIEDDACVMSKCTIAADLGAHAFIGANAVVTRSVSAHTLAAGVPAKPIEHFGPADTPSADGRFEIGQQD